MTRGCAPILGLALLSWALLIYAVIALVEAVRVIAEAVRRMW